MAVVLVSEDSNGRAWPEPVVQIVTEYAVRPRLAAVGLVRPLLTLEILHDDPDDPVICRFAHGCLGRGRWPPCDCINLGAAPATTTAVRDEWKPYWCTHSVLIFGVYGRERMRAIVGPDALWLLGSEEDKSPNAIRIQLPRMEMDKAVVAAVNNGEQQPLWAKAWNKISGSSRIAWPRSDRQRHYYVIEPGRGASHLLELDAMHGTTSAALATVPRRGAFVCASGFIYVFSTDEGKQSLRVNCHTRDVEFLPPPPIAIYNKSGVAAASADGTKVHLFGRKLEWATPAIIQTFDPATKWWTVTSWVVPDYNAFGWRYSLGVQCGRTLYHVGYNYADFPAMHSIDLADPDFKPVLLPPLRATLKTHALFLL